MKNSNRPFWQALLVQVLGTALGVLLTLGTGQLIAHRRQVQNRKMTALMVLGNIESFSRSMEAISDEMARLDTITTWLLSIPDEQIPKMDQKVLQSVIYDAVYLPMIEYDKTAQNIFGNNISTWENLGNFSFIDRVGQTFTQVNRVYEHWSNKRSELDEIYNRIYRHPDDYPGQSFAEKFLRNDEARIIIGRVHSARDYCDRNAIVVRTNNRINMKLIGITEQEVMDFCDNLESQVDEEAIISSVVLPRNPRPNKDSLYTMPAYK